MGANESLCNVSRLLALPALPWHEDCINSIRAGTSLAQATKLVVPLESGDWLWGRDKP